MDWIVVALCLVIVLLLATMWLTLDGDRKRPYDEPPTLDTRNHRDEETWTAP